MAVLLLPLKFLRMLKNGTMRQAEINLIHFLSSKEDRLKKQRGNIHKHYRNISVDEEKVLLEMCTMHAAMGYCINELTLLDLVNIITASGPNESPKALYSFVPVTMDIVKIMIRMNKDIACAVGVNPLDKQRANSATEETKNHHFTKVNNYANLLHKMERSVPNANFCDWPSDIIHIMDEVGLDITKH
eukprot:15331852-Ditylum_brightwellii.AAC.1